MQQTVYFILKHVFQINQIDPNRTIWQSNFRSEYITYNPFETIESRRQQLKRRVTPEWKVLNEIPRAFVQSVDSRVVGS